MAKFRGIKLSVPMPSGIKVPQHSRAELESQVDVLLDAIRRHKRALWGDGPVGNQADRELYLTVSVASQNALR